MIDSEQFFLELRDLYIANGLEFNHSLETFPNNKYSVLCTDMRSNCRPKSFEPIVPPASNSERNLVQQKNNRKLFSQIDIKYFKSLEEFLYAMAYELAERTGRLPDNIHSRIVLSTHDSQSRLKYILKFGC
jgi:hypothetical protein